MAPDKRDSACPSSIILEMPFHFIPGFMNAKRQNAAVDSESANRWRVDYDLEVRQRNLGRGQANAWRLMGTTDCLEEAACRDGSFRRMRWC